MPSSSAARSRSSPPTPEAKASRDGKRDATRPSGDENEQSSPSKSSPSTSRSSSRTPTPEELDARVRALYYVMQSVESRLGGGEGVEGLYGSITRTGTAKVLRSLAEHSCLGPCSHLVDVGAGLGRPLLHALADPGVAVASGVELDSVKCEKAEAFAEQSRAALLTRGKKKEDEGEDKGRDERGDGRNDDEAAWTLPSLPDIQCCPVEAMPSLEPATHVYSFWEGVPPAAREALGRLVARSTTVRGVAVVQRAMRSRGGDGDDGDDEGGASFSSVPEAVMADYGFGKLELKDSFAVSMSGSGRSFRAYVFSRDVSLLSAPATAASSERTEAAVGDSPQSKPLDGAVPRGRLPRACPLLAAAAARAEKESKAGGSWKNITTPTKPSPLSLPRSLSASSASSASTAPLLRSSSSPVDEREARRARRRAGLPAGAPPPSASSAQQPRREQQSIQSFCRVLRRAGVGPVAASSPLKGKGGSSRLGRPLPQPSSVPSSKVDSSCSSPAASAKVLASPKKAGVTKGGSGRAVAARGLGLAMAKAAAAATAGGE